ncbi:MAG: cysteine--tRNA ligase [Candidatus Gracilibacteria bacterium]|nr:cysteine--tRNA ligase [Candidatus Gracilibacteria bacterium]
MEIKLTNTLSGKKEPFRPITPGKVKLYSCGPTVYDFAHIGNFRSFLFSDLLKRVLEYAGLEVKKVMNITDVGHLTEDDAADAGGEDKISRKARAEKIDPFEIARKYEEAFHEDEKKLRILPADAYPRATEFVEEQIDLAKKLIAAGFAYEAHGSVYFRTKKFEKYGQLSGNSLENLIAGARVEVSGEKEDPLDFALWKRAEPNHLMQWESPWGKGFPGWHAECSAMSTKLLGLPFDIHTGGEDNIFPHHECEIAQNECSSGGKKSVNYWLHVKHLLVDGKKMSKSAGNFYTIRDLLEKGWKGEEIRFALLSAHYRSTLDFSMKSLEQARASIARIVEANRACLDTEFEEQNDFAEKYRAEYQQALADDLNVAGALAPVFALVSDVLKLNAEQKLDGATASAALDFLQNDFDPVFDCLPREVKVNELEKAEIESLLEKRVAARNAKNWAESDRIRDELAEKWDIEVRDGPDGQTWRVKE